MATTRSSVMPSLVSAAAASVLLAGCSGSVEIGNTSKMSSVKVADLVAEKLAATTGQPKPKVTCPEDLAAKVGTTMRCTLTGSDGGTLGVSVKVTSVDGDQINFDIKADEKASPAPS